jgi:hypothetical protein
MLKKTYPEDYYVKKRYYVQNRPVQGYSMFRTDQPKGPLCSKSTKKRPILRATTFKKGHYVQKKNCPEDYYVQKGPSCSKTTCPVVYHV